MLRLFVLVLLAVLLPLRGVTAATLPCGQPPAPRGDVVAHAHGHEMAPTPGHDHALHDHAHGGFDKGRHCLSACSAAPLMATSPTVLTPVLMGTTTFPPFAAPATTFQSDGLERPPRSL